MASYHIIVCGCTATGYEEATRKAWHAKTHSESVLVLLAGGMLLAQGILNVGCPPFIGANSCKGPQKTLDYQKEDNTVVDYEVIS